MQKYLFLVVAAYFSITSCIAAPMDASGFPGGNKEDWLKANGFYAEGNVLAGKKKYDEAIAKYQQAITVFPDDFHYHYNLGLTLKKKGDLSGAVTSLRRATELFKGKWQIWMALGNTLYSMNSHDEAKEAFAQCRALNPPPKELANIDAAIRAIQAKQK